MQSSKLKIHRATIQDAIQTLSSQSEYVKKQLQRQFNYPDLVRKTEANFLSIVAKERRGEKQKIVGFLSLDHSLGSFLSREGDIWEVLRGVPGWGLSPANSALVDYLYFSQEGRGR